MCFTEPVISALGKNTMTDIVRLTYTMCWCTFIHNLLHLQRVAKLILIVVYYKFTMDSQISTIAGHCQKPLM